MKDFFIHQKQDKEVVVGGVKMLLDFLPDEVVLSVPTAQITIQGQNLEIGYFSIDEICICGTIQGVITSKTKSSRRGGKNEKA